MPDATAAEQELTIAAGLRSEALNTEERWAVECMLDMARMYAARAEMSAEELLSLALEVERRKPQVR
jgi:hypothetical protein